MAKQCLRNLHLVVLFLLLTACVGTPATTPSPTPEPIWRLMSCEWRGTARAWIDQNTNEVWDEGEPPLSGVEIKAYGGNITQVDPVTTDAQGWVSLYTASVLCPLLRPELLHYQRRRHWQS